MLVDPNSVAPEFREAAEKRRAEQIKLRECTKKADQAKGLAERSIRIHRPVSGKMTAMAMAACAGFSGKYTVSIESETGLWIGLF